MKQLLQHRCIAVFVALYFIAFAARAQSPIIPPDNEVPNNSFRFIENNGQVVDVEGNLRPEIKFQTEGGPVKFFFTTTGFSAVYASIDPDDHIEYSVSRIDLYYESGDSETILRGEEQSSDYTNYFLGHVPQGIVNVPGYRRIHQPDVWDKIDVQYYSNEVGLKQYFIVHEQVDPEFPGGNPNDIVLRYDGANDVEVSVDGNELLIKHSGVRFTIMLHMVIK